MENMEDIPGFSGFQGACIHSSYELSALMIAMPGIQYLASCSENSVIEGLVTPSLHHNSVGEADFHASQGAPQAHEKLLRK
jgi:hypothetical protein